MSRADPTYQQSATLALVPLAGPTLNATVSRSISSNFYGGRMASGSESVGGTFLAQYGFPGGNLRFARTVSESVTMPGGNRRSSESTSLNFDHAVVMPLGTLKTVYSHKETGSDLLVLPGEISVSQEEFFRTGLEGNALSNALDYSASSEQQRNTAPDGSLGETQTQSFSAGVRFPLPGSGTGRAGVALMHSQATSKSSDTSTDNVNYSLNLQPIEKLTLNVEADSKQTTDRGSHSRRTATANLGGTLRYAPHQRFNLSAALTDSNSHDYRGTGAQQSRTSVTLGAQMSGAKNRFNLSLQLGDTTSQNVGRGLFSDLEDDSYFTVASFNYRPTQRAFINASLCSNVYHRRPGSRQTNQALSLTMSYMLSDDVSWQFIYRGDDRATRQDATSVGYGDTIQTSFQFRF